MPNRECSKKCEDIGRLIIGNQQRNPKQGDVQRSDVVIVGQVPEKGAA